MPWLKRDKFLNEVVKCIKFPFDRESVKIEMQSHIDEKIDDYIERGYSEEEAEILSIKDMGDPKEIGNELDKQHNPIVGWIWKITNVLASLFSVICGMTVIIPLLVGLICDEPFKQIPESEIVYEVKVDEQVKIDDVILKFTKVVYDKNKNMNIFYEYFDTKLWGTGWSCGTIGNIYDNLGNRYISGTGGSSSGIRTQGVRTVRDFSEEADTLIIQYDNYNRNYKVEIPLKAGDDNE